MTDDTICARDGNSARGSAFLTVFTHLHGPHSSRLPVVPSVLARAPSLQIQKRLEMKISQLLQFVSHCPHLYCGIASPESLQPMCKQPCFLFLAMEFVKKQCLSHVRIFKIGTSIARRV